MGAGQSSDFDYQRITEIATEANGQFAKDFQVAFKDTVITKIKNAYLDGEGKAALLKADTPKQVIKSGYLMKIGGNVKNWKRRFFVANNKADNFLVIYYEDEHLIKEKGRFSCCGYHVESFSVDEMNWYGPFGIKLASHDGSKRQWLFKAHDEADQSQWLEVFMNACKKATPEPEKDPVFIDSFKSAFRMTKAAYGYFGVCFIFGTECEMLEHLCNQILTREILDQYLLEHSKSSTPSAIKSLAVQIHNDIQKIIKPIVENTWRNCFVAADGLKASFELTVKASLRTLIDKENEIKVFLNDRINDLVKPYLEDLKTTFCLPILQHCQAKIIKSFELAMKGFCSKVLGKLSAMEGKQEKVALEMSKLEESVENLSRGPLCEPQRILWELHTVDLLDLQDIFEISGIAGYDVYISTMDDLRELVHNAIHTFERLLSPVKATEGLADLAGMSDKILRGSTYTARRTSTSTNSRGSVIRGSTIIHSSPVNESTTSPVPQSEATSYKNPVLETPKTKQERVDIAPEIMSSDDVISEIVLNVPAEEKGEKEVEKEEVVETVAARLFGKSTDVEKDFEKEKENGVDVVAETPLSPMTPKVVKIEEYKTEIQGQVVSDKVAEMSPDSRLEENDKLTDLIPASTSSSGRSKSVAEPPTHSNLLEGEGYSPSVRQASVTVPSESPGGDKKGSRVTAKNLREVLVEVLQRMMLDVSKTLKTRLTRLLLDAIEANVQEMMIAPSLDEVLYAQGLITKETSFLVSLSCLGESMIRDKMTTFVHNILKNPLAEANMRFKKVLFELVEKALHGRSRSKSNSGSPTERKPSKN